MWDAGRERSRSICARRTAPGRIVGIDRSDDVLAQAAAYAAEQQVDVTFEPGDVYALAYDDASFDVVHAHQVLQHLSDPVAALAEMRRVTRSGGVVAARDGDYACFSWAPLDPRLDRWLEIYRSGRAAQQRRAGRRALSQEVGARCRLHRRALLQLYMDLRRPRVVCVVGRLVG